MLPEIAQGLLWERASLAEDIAGPPPPRLSLGDVLACGGGPGRCPFTDTTVRQGNMAAPGVAERRSETETVIKSFFTHLTPSRKLFSVLSEGEEGGGVGAKRPLLTLWPSW